MTDVDYAVSDGVATITLNRPPVNALNASLIADIDAAVGLAQDPEVRAVVITGSQRRLVRVLAEVEAALRASLRQTATSSGALAPEILDRVLARQVDPWSVASEMVAGGWHERP